MLQHMVERAPVGEARELVGERRPAQLVALQLRVQQRSHHVGEEAQLAAVLGADPGSALAHRHQVAEVHAGARHRDAHGHLPGPQIEQSEAVVLLRRSRTGRIEDTPRQTAHVEPLEPQGDVWHELLATVADRGHQLVQAVLAEHLVQDRPATPGGRRRRPPDPRQHRSQVRPHRSQARSPLDFTSLSGRELAAAVTGTRTGRSAFAAVAEVIGGMAQPVAQAQLLSVLADADRLGQVPRRPDNVRLGIP